MMFRSMVNLKSLLAHPLTRGLDIDDPKTTYLRKEILREKRFLRKIYKEWYRVITEALPEGEGPVLELGSGAGFLSDFIPGLITSEVFQCRNVKLILDGQHLPFGDRTLRGIVMTDVLHHLPKVRSFLHEASRCVRPGGVINMIEPWISSWSKVIYGHLQNEPLLLDEAEWEVSLQGPLSTANIALPWIVFERDRYKFECEFSKFKILSIEPFMPFCYLVSGGLSMRSLMPGCTFNLWYRLESALSSHMKNLGMFAHIVLQRVE